VCFLLTNNITGKPYNGSVKFLCRSGQISCPRVLKKKYKDCFNGYVTNSGDIMIRNALNRRKFLGRTIEYVHESK
jgi:hypothetical protein